MARALITMPNTAKRGEMIEIRVLLAHPMESGFRPDAQGRTLPRDIITRFTCRYGDDTVFSAELSPAVAANPYIAFFVTATASANLTFSWQGDNGFTQQETMPLTVT
jgi:sulfur-oxidizing protein SoxZ